MKEKPILFTGPMVRAILEGRKTQTRRLVKPQPTSGFHPEPVGLYSPTKVDARTGEAYPGKEVYGAADEDEGYVCHYFPGTRLWVRETFCLPDPTDRRTICYRASGHEVTTGEKWKPSIFMPRWASRITLEVTAVRVERLQGISEGDAKAEGAARCFIDKTHPDFQPGKLHTCREDYQLIWDSVNGKTHPWKDNCWVWVITFKPISPPQAPR